MEDRKKGSERTKRSLRGDSGKGTLCSQDQDKHVGALLSCVLPLYHLFNWMKLQADMPQ